MLLNQRLPLLSLWRTIYYLPAVTSGVAVSLLWAWIFQPHFGILNAILWTALHVPGPQRLSDPFWVIPAFVIMGLWGIGAPMLIYLSGLQDIPTHLYEAAELDGAGRLRRPWHVTLPMTTPVILFNLIMGIIALGAVVVLIPIFWMISTSVKTQSDALAFPPIWVPATIRLQNYGVALTFLPFGLYFRNTLFICAATEVGAIVSSCLVAYAFARPREGRPLRRAPQHADDPLPGDADPSSSSSSSSAGSTPSPR